MTWTSFLCLKNAFYKNFWNIWGQEPFLKSCAWTHGKRNLPGGWAFCSGPVKVDQYQLNPTASFFPLGIFYCLLFQPRLTHYFLLSYRWVEGALSYPCGFPTPTSHTQRKTLLLIRKSLFFSLELGLLVDSLCVSVGHPDTSGGSIFSSEFQRWESASHLSVLLILGDPCWPLAGVTAFSNFLRAFHI